MNNSTISAIAVVVIAAGWLTYRESTNFKYEQELNIQREYLKVCEARMLYLDFVIKKAGRSDTIK